MKATFNHLLDRWIGDRGYEAVAPVLGASMSTVHSWRHGKTLPPSTRIGALAAAMGVPERKLRQIIDRDRASRHAAHDESAPVDAIGTEGART